MARLASLLIPVHGDLTNDMDPADLATDLAWKAELSQGREGFRFTGTVDWEVVEPAGQVRTCTDEDTGELVAFTDPYAYVRASGPAVPVG